MSQDISPESRALYGDMPRAGSATEVIDLAEIHAMLRAHGEVPVLGDEDEPGDINTRDTIPAPPPSA